MSTPFYNYTRMMPKNIRNFKKSILSIAFETEEGSSSPHRLAITQLKDRQIGITEEYYIKPTDEKSENSVHHEAQTFPEIWDKLKSYFDETIIIAYNALQEIRTLKGLLQHYQLPLPNPFSINCIYELTDMSLADACFALGVSLPSDPDILDITRANAEIFAQFLIEDDKKFSDKVIALREFELPLQEKDNPLLEQVQEDPSWKFYDASIVVTGEFRPLSRALLEAALAKKGARITTSISPQTDLLVVGHEPKQKMLISRLNFDKEGYPIPMMNEQQILQEIPSDLYQ